MTEQILTVKIVERTEGKPFPDQGEAYIINSENNGQQIMIRCPRCNNAAITQHSVSIKNDVPTISPSFGCFQCGFHSWLKNGVHEQLSDFK